jgi:hypothetical protein
MSSINIPKELPGCWLHKYIVKINGYIQYMAADEDSPGRAVLAPSGE